MTIVDFFDPHNIDHIKAYVHLMEHGTWPEGFPPKEVTHVACWSIELPHKMAMAWVAAVKNSQVFGFPPYEDEGETSEDK